MAEVPGNSLMDLLPTPADTSAVTAPGKKEVSHTLADKPTASHALAIADHDEKGHAQAEHDKEVINLGWNEPGEKIAAPLVGGMDNDELWILIRRFNKQMYHVKESPYPVPGNLDLIIADEEEFSPDKLRSNVERLYMTVIIGFISCAKQMARLRSWREKRRTTWFCVVYFLAWFLDLLVPTISVVLIALITYPPARELLFPPAPIALVDSSTGGLQKPKAGVLGSTDSATGAPENHKGEAVEQEASNFVNGVATVALSSVAGKHPQAEPEGEENNPAYDAVPDPTAIAMGAANAKEVAAGGQPTARHDKTKAPVESAIWNKMRPIMHGIAEAADTWERFGNALSPTPPFPKDTYRLRLATLIVPVLFASLFVTSYMFVKGATFGVGFGFFGNPIIMRALALLNRRFPHWEKILEIRNTILKGVPTNAQLTITLLRIGEANKAPIPPAPRKDTPPPDKPVDLSEEDLRASGADSPLDATDEELHEAINHDPAVAHETDGKDIDASKDTKHGKKGSKILGLFKTTTKATVQTAIGADKVKASIGSEHAKRRLGAVPQLGEDLTSGPVDFKCRYHGKRGHLYISTKSNVPYVAFSTNKSIEKIGSMDRDDLHPAWKIPISDVKELKKIGGYGWKAKLVVGWALERPISDGIEIVDRKGNQWSCTAMPLRDELFNRLIAMGGQKWISW